MYGEDDITRYSNSAAQCYNLQTWNSDKESDIN